MKRKTLLLFLSAALACSVLTGCGSSEEVSAPSATDVSEGEEGTEEEEVAEDESAVEEVAPEGTYKSELTGEWIDESLQSQRPVAIMVDNEKTALLHYGLTQADIVYEMMNSTANGEITRFMAIVKDWGSITQFGSIRSVRPTNFMIAPEYNAVLVHDGGPFYINAYLSNPWVEHFSGGFSRVNNGKPREFTEYVMSGDLEDRFESTGVSTSYDDYYPGPHWQFTTESAPIELADASDSIDCTLIDLPFPHNSSQLDYDEDSGLYLYSEYGMKHTDPANGNAQLSFTNVILQCAEHHQYDSNGYMQFNILNESGEGYYITGGKAIPVTWSKGNDVDPTRFYDAEGNEITLNIGKTYVGLVSESRWDELVLE